MKTQLFCGATWVMCIFQVGASQDARVTDAHALNFSLHKKTTFVLPYQAVRLQVKLRNDTRQTVNNPTDIRAILNCEFAVQYADSKQETPIRNFVKHIGDEVSIRKTEVLDRGDYPYVLSANEQTSLVFAVAADWDKGVAPVFGSPGVYDLSVCLPIIVRTFQRNRPEEVSDLNLYRAQCRIVVSNPKDDDIPIQSLIAANKELQSALLSPFDLPNGNVVGQLKQIVHEHPDSTYANYARFALARHIVRGSGFDWLPRATRESLRGLYGTYIDNPQVTEESIRWMFRNRNTGIAFGNLTDQEHVDLIELFIAARAAGGEQREQMLNEIVGWAYVSEQDRREAINWLNQIKSKDFAYYPHALCVKWIALQGVDDEWALEVEHELNEHFYDALPWIHIQRYRIKTPREWHDFRIRLVKDRPNRG